MSEKVPEGWKRVDLEECISALLAGQSPNRKEHPAREGKYGILKTTAIDWDRFDYKQNQEVLDNFTPNISHTVLKDDILITKAGPAHRVGVVALVKKVSPNILLSGKMTSIRVNEKLYPNYLSFALCMQDAQNHLQANTTGMASSQTNFTHEALKRVPILTPPLPEQKKIASILTSVDDVIETTQRQIDKLQDLKKATMNELLTKGIGHTEFKDSILGLIPKSWEVVTLEDAVTAPICYGIVQVGEFDENGIEVVAIKYLGKISHSRLHRASKLIEKKYKRSRVQENDLLISIKATIGRLDIVPKGFSGNISRDIARVRFAPSCVPEVMLSYLESSIGKKNISKTTVGTTRAELSINRLKELSVPIIPLKEQIKIKEIYLAFNNTLNNKTHSLNQIQSLKKSLMQDLLTGKVRVQVN